MVSSWWSGVVCGNVFRGSWSLRGLAGGERAQCGLRIMNTGSSSIWRRRGVPGRECHLVSPTAEAASLSCGLLGVWWRWCAGIGGVVAVTVRAFVTVDESVCEEDGSDNEEKDEDKEDYICQLLDQRTASQRRDKSCAPSH